MHEDKWLRDFVRQAGRYVPDDVELIERGGRIFFAHARFRFDLLTLGVMAAGTTMNAMAARQQGKASAAINKYNAAVDEKAAGQIEKAGLAEQAERKDRTRQLLAANRVAYGKSGVGMAGSPLLNDLDVLEKGVLDSEMTGYNARTSADQKRSEAVASRLAANSARRAGRLGIGQALFGGATDALILNSRKKEYA